MLSLEDVGSLIMSIASRRPLATGIARPGHSATKASLGFMFAEIEELIGRIGARRDFIGFTVEDIVEVAACFRREDELEKWIKSLH